MLSRHRAVPLWWLLFLLTACSAEQNAQKCQEDSPEPGLPRVIRYVSTIEGYAGRTCYGVVLTAKNGIPLQVRNLASYDPRLCYDIPGVHPELALMKLAFAAAEALYSSQPPGSHAIDEDVETLAESDLAEVVKPPVRITEAELDARQRFVIGVGLNYESHRAEVGREADGKPPPGDLLFFPKVVAPTGPYAPVRTGTQIGEDPPRPVLLLDYEVELAFVLLEDLNLAQPASSYDEFIETVAFFTANDVSDREPIILDPESGYTRGKSRPTYLPIGPWMVHGRHLRPKAVEEGNQSLEIALSVRERLPCVGCKETPFRTRMLQCDVTDSMIYGPWRLVRRLSTLYQEGRVVCMRDAYGIARYIHNEDGVVPAGSIILTGTPGGTAIREPGILAKASLFVRGGFSIEGAKRQFVRDSEEAVANTSYLEAGDQVESWVQHLGRQRWILIPDRSGVTYGVDSSGRCPQARSSKAK